MLSFKKNQTIFRFTERLSFKKMKNEEEDVDFYAANRSFYHPDEVYDQVNKKRFTRKRSTIPFAEYTPPSKSVKNFETQYHQDVLDYRPTKYCYRYDGSVDCHATVAAQTQQNHSPRSQFSFWNAIEETFEEIKTKRANEKMEKRNNARFPGAGKVNANVRIQFDGEKYVYRV